MGLPSWCPDTGCNHSTRHFCSCLRALDKGVMSTWELGSGWETQRWRALGSALTLLRPSALSPLVISSGLRALKISLWGSPKFILPPLPRTPDHVRLPIQHLQWTSKRHSALLLQNWTALPLLLQPELGPPHLSSGSLYPSTSIFFSPHLTSNPLGNPPGSRFKIYLECDLFSPLLSPLWPDHPHRSSGALL